MELKLTTLFFHGLDSLREQPDSGVCAYRAQILGADKLAQD